MQIGRTTMKPVHIYPTELMNTLWPINSTARYIPKRIESGTHTDICTPVFIAALFTIAKSGGKNPNGHWQMDE